MPTIDTFQVNAIADIPDFRDRMYEPALEALVSEIPPPTNLHILDQKSEGACTGFGLAAVINLLAVKQGRAAGVSPRMLYEMARRFDEWPGEEYAGSSCRGAIKGWYNMGVCPAPDWPYRDNQPGILTEPRARAAREMTIGAYYRIRPAIVDYHAALNEAGVIYTSALVHGGWRGARVRNGNIRYRGNETSIGGHAFAIVGYDDLGFFVQNSWGSDWGANGVAHWSYEDWQANVRDAWVVQLARPTPQIFPGFAHAATASSAAEREEAPRRNEIMGHFVHLDDGRFHDEGRYFSNLQDVIETADFVANSANYDHLLLYAHGGLNSTKASARRIRAMKETFKANRIYPYHFMYDTGLGEEIKDVLLGRRSQAEERVQGFTDWTDQVLESITRIPGRALWREMKQGASSPFVRGGDGSKVVNAFLDRVPRTGANAKKIHLVGHSTGGILMGHLLGAFARHTSNARVQTVSLMAPAATITDYNNLYEPRLGRVGDFTVYNLSDDLELDDNVAGLYRKSLLCLVSRSFEDKTPEELLGISAHVRKYSFPSVNFVVSRGKASRRGGSASRSHGGFDNDPATMNHIVRRVLGKGPRVPFTKEILGG